MRYITCDSNDRNFYTLQVLTILLVFTCHLKTWLSDRTLDRSHSFPKTWWWEKLTVFPKGICSNARLMGHDQQFDVFFCAFEKWHSSFWTAKFPFFKDDFEKALQATVILTASLILFSSTSVVSLNRFLGIRLLCLHARLAWVAPELILLFHDYSAQGCSTFTPHLPQDPDLCLGGKWLNNDQLPQDTKTLLLPLGL